MTDDILLLLQNFIGNWHMYIKDTFGWKNTFEVLIIVAILMIFYQKFIKKLSTVIKLFKYTLVDIIKTIDYTYNT